MTSKVKGQSCQVTWRVWEVLADQSRMKRPIETQKNGGMLYSSRAIMRTSFNVKGQRSPGRLMFSQEMRNIFRTGRPMKFKLGIQRRKKTGISNAPWPPRSKAKVARSRDASDRCWPISRERNDLETPKLFGRLFTPRAIMCTSFKVKDKGQGHQTSGVFRARGHPIAHRPRNFCSV